LLAAFRWDAPESIATIAGAASGLSAGSAGAFVYRSHWRSPQRSSGKSLDSGLIRFKLASTAWSSDRRRGTKGSTPMWILLLLPFIGLLWVPFYNFQEPALFGFPFFYWYQLVWVPISSLLIWLVYRRRAPDQAP
jgi:hypothetical protein